MHRSGQICALTRAPLPELGGCCHHNITLLHGPQRVIREMLAPLHLGPNETDLERVLLIEDVAYQVGSEGQLWVDPDNLALPKTYGLGTDHLPEEKFFWCDCGQ